jgi:hypothetical protein
MRKISLAALTVVAVAPLTLASSGAVADNQPSQNASCQGQVNGYYNSHYSDGGQLTSEGAQQDGYSDAVVLGAQSHDCNVPAGVPAGEPKSHGSNAP